MLSLGAGKGPGAGVGEAARISNGKSSAAGNRRARRAVIPSTMIDD